MSNYMHVWDSGDRSEGCIIGTVNGKQVEFTHRDDTDTPEMPTDAPVYSRIEYLGCLDDDHSLDYSWSYPMETGA